jgi:hypothetical protein
MELSRSVFCGLNEQQNCHHSVKISKVYVELSSPGD